MHQLGLDFFKNGVSEVFAAAQFYDYGVRSDSREIGYDVP
jgi:hypothetical protein